MTILISPVMMQVLCRQPGIIKNKKTATIDRRFMLEREVLFLLFFFFLPSLDDFRLSNRLDYLFFDDFFSAARNDDKYFTWIV